MKALILQNKVIEVSDAEFDVHPNAVWVDCDDTVERGDSYENNEFISNKQTQEELDAINAEAEAYKATKESGFNKLISLGLTQEEASALTGYRPAS